MSKKFIIANWKMLPTTWAEAEGLLEAIDEYLGTLNEKKELSLVICPPFVFMEEAAKLLDTSHLKHEAELGAQDIAVDDSGAFTGRTAPKAMTTAREVSGPMLSKLGVHYVIVGHSDRRWKLGESDETVNKKLKAVLHNGMTPIVCLGERERDGEWEKELQRQTEATFNGLSTSQVHNCLIAYEPVWAISTTPGARPDTPVSAAESIKIIKGALSYRLQVTGYRFLYGGSITPDNAKEFLSNDVFSGILVGGASVRKDDFLKILTIATKI